ncbi:MAG: hypothetical protein HZA34_01605 [Candidatus Pacebacteria bacterium]|nr:hypothetical protein [Candidatus Paceibacterota bacterium]
MKSQKKSFSSSHSSAQKRFKEYLTLLLIVFLSFVTALAVFFLDATKDLRNRAVDDVSMVCNRQCSENRECLSNMVCWPYGRPSDQKGLCRLDSNPNNEKCEQRKGVGFIIQVYEDKNADGIRNNNEQGQSWEFQWDKNEDEYWRQYITYAEKNGEGGRVSDVAPGDRIRIRVKEKGGWEVTTPKEMKSVMADETTKVSYFGVRVPPVPSPTVKKSTTVTKTVVDTSTTQYRMLGSKASPTPSPSLSPSPVPTPTPTMEVRQQSGGFLWWLRMFFRRLYCSVTKTCTEY